MMEEGDHEIRLPPGRDWANVVAVQMSIPIQRRPLTLGRLVAVLAAVEEHYRKSVTSYEHVSHLGDSVALLRVLRDGIEARDEWLRRLKAGLPTDFKLKPPI